MVFCDLIFSLRVALLHFNFSYPHLNQSATLRYSKQGVVVAVGPGRRAADGSLIPMGVATGDSVMLPEYGGMNVKIENDEFQIFRDEDIVGILKE